VTPTSAPTARKPRPEVVPAVARLAARARAQRSDRRHRRLRRVAVGLVALLAVGGLGWVVLLSSWLAVDDVQVTGSSRLTPEQIASAADIRTGHPLARVDTAGVAGRVRQLPPVADVAVLRSLPGTVRIAVTERQPVAAYAAPDGIRLIDATGVSFATVATAPDGLVRLEVARPAPDDPSTRAALQVATDLPGELRATVAAVRADSPVAVTLILLDGRQVVWGRPGDTATKAAAVAALLPMPGSTVDVSAPGVAVRR
jgi:cell division protein FtsQ